MEKDIIAKIDAATSKIATVPFPPLSFYLRDEDVDDAGGVVGLDRLHQQLLQARPVVHPYLNLLMTHDDRKR